MTKTTTGHTIEAAMARADADAKALKAYRSHARLLLAATGESLESYEQRLLEFTDRPEQAPRCDCRLMSFGTTTCDECKHSLGCDVHAAHQATKLGPEEAHQLSLGQCGRLLTDGQTTCGRCARLAHESGPCSIGTTNPEES